MNRRLKKVMAAVILMGAMSMVQGCGGNREEAKASSGGRVLAVATEAAYPPFRYVGRDKHLVGFEIDLAKEIGQRMGRKSKSVTCPLTVFWMRWQENRWTWP